MTVRLPLRVAAAAVIACCPLLAQSLRDLADQRHIRIGTAVAPARLAEPAYADTLVREFNQVEPENAMKFGPIHPGPTDYNFAPADALVTFAREHKQVVRGHTLVWHNQVAPWVAKGSYTSAQLSTILHDHIQTVLKHFAGQVYAWDVVNESFNDDGTLRSTVWFDKPGIGLKGTAYIEQAFRWAHEADPKALLFYNDYSAEPINAKSDAIYAMLKDFKTRGVPVNGVGMQMHLTKDTGSLSTIEANMKRLADLGLEIQITELDVRIPVNASGTVSPADLATQTRIYHDIVALCLKFRECTAIQTWGFTDKYSWVPHQFPGTGAALEFDADYHPKAAYESIKQALDQ